MHFRPVNTTLSRHFTVTSIFVNTTSHPALHTTTTETNEYLLSPGMTCPILPVLGSRGTLIRPVCVECTLLPSGNDMVSRRVVSYFSVRGASVTRKFPVAPESSTSQFLMFLLMRPTVANMLFAS